MIQSILAKILLAPLSLLYGLGMSLRDFFYRQGLLKSIEFNLPVISVGNLSVGGAGKTPHIEYLIRLMREYLNIATLSRGYKRKTRGYIELHPSMTAEQGGDEPLQFKRKFPDVMTVVSENRAFAIPKILMSRPDIQLVLLDDAFQHRSVKPGLNILLTEFNHPFTKDFLLPSGRLREWRSAYERADVMIVSKCPPIMEESDKQRFIEEIKPLPHQKLFFSYYDYDPSYYIFNQKYQAILQPDWDVLLISAIAKTDYLLDYLESQVNSVKVIEYEDHHLFDKFDMANLKARFEDMDSDKKIIITTEKDAMRLELHKKFLIDSKLPVFALPAKVNFHFDEGPVFDEHVKEYLKTFKV
jgi:tetraacyldisaccharide 4'-kinase